MIKSTINYLINFSYLETIFKNINTMTVNVIIFDFVFTLFYLYNPSVERYTECFKQGLLKSINLLKEKQVWNDKISEDQFLERFKKERAIA